MPITPFHPINSGFKFDNGFENPIISVPLLHIDIRTRGRCGGMAYASLDYWFNNLPIPECATLPSDGTLLADYIYARLGDSMFANGLRFVDFVNMLDHPTWLKGKGAARVTREDEFPKIKAQIDAGKPCVVGLCQARDIGQIGNDHQVVCFGYEEGPDRSTLLIYDNNFPDVAARLDFTTHYVPTDKDIREDVGGECWRAFFLEDYQPRRPWYLNEGTLLKDQGGPAVRQIRGGGSFWIKSPDEFAALGLKWGDVKAVGDGSLNELDCYPGDGSLVRDRDNDAVHVVYGGKPFHIPNPETFTAMGFHWENVMFLPSGSVSRMRATPRDRTLLKDRSNPSVFEVVNGALRHVVSPAVFDANTLSWSNVRVVPDGALAGMTQGPPVT